MHAGGGPARGGRAEGDARPPLAGVVSPWQDRPTSSNWKVVTRGPRSRRPPCSPPPDVRASAGAAGGPGRPLRRRRARPAERDLVPALDGWYLRSASPPIPYPGGTRPEVHLISTVAVISHGSSARGLSCVGAGALTSLTWRDGALSRLESSLVDCSRCRVVAQSALREARAMADVMEFFVRQLKGVLRPRRPAPDGPAHARRCWPPCAAE